MILGQPDENASVVSSFTDLFHPLLRQSAADITPTPTGLAWDGTNLYVTDPSNRRVLVFTPERAAGSHQRRPQRRQPADFRAGIVHPGGNHHRRGYREGDHHGYCGHRREYDYTMVKDDTLATAMTGLAAAINAGSGDPAVFAEFEPILQTIKLVARVPGTGWQQYRAGGERIDQRHLHHHGQRIHASRAARTPPSSRPARW